LPTGRPVAGRRSTAEPSSSASASTPVTSTRRSPRVRRGTGPYRFVAYVVDDRVELARNDDYVKPELPYLDRPIFRAIPDANLLADGLRGRAAGR
jgi:ABC-type transport system substrate-binding protein